MDKSVDVNKDKQAQDIYPFANALDQQLFTKVTQELRCSVCQNQNLTDSMAPLAISLRQEIYQRVQNGASEQEIVEFVTSRYGEFVLYRPPLALSTSVLWFGPFIILSIGFLLLRRFIR